MAAAQMRRLAVRAPGVAAELDHTAQKLEAAANQLVSAESPTIHMQH
jgi:hypothetical protein